MPDLPVAVDAEHRATVSPAVEAQKATSPYQRIAADLRGAIQCGAYRPGDHLPTVEELKERYGVSTGTAHRAISSITELGLAKAGRGRRAVVVET